MNKEAKNVSSSLNKELDDTVVYFEVKSEPDNWGNQHFIMYWTDFSVENPNVKIWRGQVFHARMQEYIYRWVRREKEIRFI